MKRETYKHTKGYVLFFVFFSLLLLLFAEAPSRATIEFTCQTGQPCSFCHENPHGGGTLTAEGEDFMIAGYSFENEPTSFHWKRLLKLLFGFLHILFAIVWFGTIFYIHLFVRPSSLTSGLPRNERILGWTCIFLVGITGILLTILRLRSLSELWTTTFGIVWLVKVSIFVIMVGIAVLATTRINRKLREVHAQKASEVPHFPNERQGTPKTFVFEGVLYDVDQSRFWKDGIHMGRHRAGSDLTSAMAGAPHGAEVLDRVRKLGPSGNMGEKAKSHVVRRFVFMAYLILFCMLGVIFCIAYWNWGSSLVTP